MDSKNAVLFSLYFSIGIYALITAWCACFLAREIQQDESAASGSKNGTLRHLNLAITWLFFWPLASTLVPLFVFVVSMGVYFETSELCDSYIGWESEYVDETGSRDENSHQRDVSPYSISRRSSLEHSSSGSLNYEREGTSTPSLTSNSTVSEEDSVTTPPPLYDW
ncbi:hypothetical protein F4820DRAFT_465864 [Hypoxylon rubiginosum]|uniref:Uncharacterized protein n=1 Tax=Hypoxylon rubiginosum TaxID=110542 RepID=A0ACB9YMD6_9PEZI|nr:hypothetical protein F4820DRAFT_465864 [Hypoxylon rubiginosum]